MRHYCPTRTLRQRTLRPDHSRQEYTQAQVRLAHSLLSSLVACNRSSSRVLVQCFSNARCVCRTQPVVNASAHASSFDWGMCVSQPQRQHGYVLHETPSATPRSSGVPLYSYRPRSVPKCGQIINKKGLVHAAISAKGLKRPHVPGRGSLPAWQAAKAYNLRSLCRLPRRPSCLLHRLCCLT